MNETITKQEHEDRSKQLIAELGKDELRSLFYLFAGKPDSRIKVFDEAVHITKSDIEELNSCITRKLETHNIDATITSVRIGYSGSELNEFGTWSEFESHHWQEPQEVEEVVVKWDFLVNIREYKAPQRHTLLFRLSHDIKPTQVLQMLSSGNSEDLESLDIASAPAFCRVDFINAQISKELINEVASWYSGRAAPKLIPEIWYWCKKKRQLIALLFDHWCTLSWALLISSVALYYSSSSENVQLSLPVIGVGVFLAVYSLRPINRIAHALAARIFKSLAQIEGSRVVFEFTSGDKKKISELEARNKTQGRKFLWASGWNLLLNVAAAIVYAYFFSSSGAL